MANSMDTILVRYSESEKPISLREFIYPNNNPPLKLTEKEKKIQEATRLVYELNGKEPPLYKKFVNYNPQKPLTINCLNPRIRSGIEACYSTTENEVSFVNGDGDLVESLAHELKHAEQHSQPEIQQVFEGGDNLAKAALHLMNEAEAFYAGVMASVEIGQDKSSHYYTKLYQQILKEYTDKKGRKDNQAIKQKMMEKWMEREYILASHEASYYCLQIEVDFPPNISDVGLKHIPAHYGLTKDFLTVLQDIPEHTGMIKRIEIIKKIHDELSELTDKKPEKEKQLTKNFGQWVVQMKTPQNLQILFDTIKDEKGNLPFSREIFDIQDSKNQQDSLIKCESSNGQNILLKALDGNYSGAINYKYMSESELGIHDTQLMMILSGCVSRDYCLGAIPILMSLKDKEEKPIISQENIDRFPEKSLLASAVKAYKSQGTNTGESGLIQTLSQNTDKESSSDKKQLPSSVLKRRNTPQAGD